MNRGILEFDLKTVDVPPIIRQSLEADLNRIVPAVGWIKFGSPVADQVKPAPEMIAARRNKG